MLKVKAGQVLKNDESMFKKKEYLMLWLLGIILPALGYLILIAEGQMTRFAETMIVLSYGYLGTVCLRMLDRNL